LNSTFYYSIKLGFKIMPKLEKSEWGCSYEAEPINVFSIYLEGSNIKRLKVN